jgi:hypothetical protein
VYAIGVQECMILPQLKTAILSHLNLSGDIDGSVVVGKSEDFDGEGAKKKTTTTTSTTTKTSGKVDANSNGNGYVMHCREIGSTKTNMGFHGMIALMVWFT